MTSRQVIKQVIQRYPRQGDWRTQVAPNIWSTEVLFRVRYGIDPDWSRTTITVVPGPELIVVTITEV
jgi:hypothetical protein